MPKEKWAGLGGITQQTYGLKHDKVYHRRYYKGIADSISFGDMPYTHRIAFELWVMRKKKERKKEQKKERKNE